MLATTVTGGLGATNDMNYLCTSSCIGKDTNTQTVFKALQAQLNRVLKGAMAHSPDAKSAATLQQLLLTVDGKIGTSTVRTYTFFANILPSQGLNVPVPGGAATMASISASAYSIAQTFQGLGDRTGLPPAEVSLPGMPSAPAALSPAVLQKLQTLFANPTVPTGPDVGLPASELVSMQLSPTSFAPGFGPGQPSATVPWYKRPLIWGIVGGGVVLVGGYFVLSRKK